MQQAVFSTVHVKPRGRNYEKKSFQTPVVQQVWVGFRSATSCGGLGQPATPRSASPLSSAGLPLFVEIHPMHSVIPMDFSPSQQSSDVDVCAALDFISYGDDAPRTSGSCLAGVNFEVIPGRLSFTIHCNEDETRAAIDAHRQLFYFSSWMQESYEPFNSDFGPVNLSGVVQFCQFLQAKMTDKRLAKRHLVYYCDAETAHVTNTAFLLGTYLVLVENWTAEEAAKPFETISPSPFKPYRDVTSVRSTFDLELVDCLRGLQRAVECGFFSFENFDIDAYEELDDMEVADAHIICPKFLAFRGPTDIQDQDGVHLSPSTYLPLFASLNVSTVVRLNEAQYDKGVFEGAGMGHHDLYFDDCTSPSEDTVRRFLRICDAAPGMVAVHCYAGLGRTGTLIAAWIMTHYGWTAREAIAWLRIVRPGSVIGPQQHFLELWEAAVREAGGGGVCAVASEKLARRTVDSELIAAQVTKAADRRRGATFVRREFAEATL